MAQSTIAAPATLGVATSTSYFDPGDDIWVECARRIVVWFNDGTSNVEGTVKYRIGNYDWLEFTIPAENGLVLLEVTGCKGQLPPINIDAKALAGTPKLYVSAV